MENLLTYIIVGAAGVAILTINAITAIKLPAHEMKRRYVTGQCVVGRIAAAIFYAPAWVIKGVAFIVLYIRTVHKVMNGKSAGIAARI